MTRLVICKTCCGEFDLDDEPHDLLGCHRRIVDRYRRALAYVAGQCGIPDPIEACRAILATTRRVLDGGEP